MGKAKECAFESGVEIAEALAGMLQNAFQRGKRIGEYPETERSFRYGAGKPSAVAEKYEREASPSNKLKITLPPYYEMAQTHSGTPVDRTPAHLRDDAPYVVCDTCGRKSWAKEHLDRTAFCGMTQPNGYQCVGIFVRPR